MLYREVLGAIIAVGLHPGLGFFHRPRSAAHTLALDLMELFRVSVVDMAFLAALNRRTFDADVDFSDTAGACSSQPRGERRQSRSSSAARPTCGSTPRSATPSPTLG